MLKHFTIKTTFRRLTRLYHPDKWNLLKNQLLLKKEVNSLKIFQMLTKAFCHHVFSSKNIILDFFCGLIK